MRPSMSGWHYSKYVNSKKWVTLSLLTWFAGEADVAEADEAFVYKYFSKNK